MTSHDYVVETGLLRETKSTVGSRVLRDLVYDYDEARNPKQRTVDGQIELFGHDLLDRLVTWEHGNDATNDGVVYTYDDIGNMLTRQDVQFTDHVPGQALDQISFTPGDGTLTDGNGRTVGPHQIATSSLGSHTYNARGDQEVAPGRTATFTSFGLPRSITAGTETTTFAYDSGNARVIKKSGDAKVITLGGGLFERRIVGGEKTNVFYIEADGRPVAQITRVVAADGSAQETVQYLHEDHLQSIEAVTSEYQQVIARHKYDPFGARIGNAAPGIRIGFDGLEHDDELGLINMNGRVYDPKQARFLTSDPVVPDPLQSQHFNRYAFVANSPLNWRDPSGFDYTYWTNEGPNETTTHYVYEDGSSAPQYDYSAAQSQQEQAAWRQEAASQAMCDAGSVAYQGGYNAGNGVQSAAFPEGAAPSTAPMSPQGPQGGGPGPQKADYTPPGGFWGGTAGGTLMAEPGFKPGLEFARWAAEVGMFIAGTVGAPEGGILEGLAPKGAGLATRGTSVLGSYPKYLEKAAELGAERFNIPTSIWNKMSAVEQWAANQRFLDRLIQRGDQVILSTPAAEARAGSSFARELEYLQSQGYRLNAEGTALLPP